MAYKAYKYRIYPNTEQEVLIQKTFGCVRFVYNYFLAERIKLYDEKHEHTSFYKQCRELTVLKNENEWLKEPDKNALQYALHNLQTSYENFFRKYNDGSYYGFPRFKKKKDNRNSYTTSADNHRTYIKGNTIRLPKIGFVKAKISRQIPECHRIITATVSQNRSGSYYVSVLTEYQFQPPIISLDKSNSLGLDYSSGHFYVDSNGDSADMPHFFRNMENKLSRENRRMSKMQYGSHNWEKQRIKVARIHEKIHNQRFDWQHKRSTEIANKYDFVGVEDINYQWLAGALSLGKSTKDNSFGQFRDLLDYKLYERGKKLVRVDRWFPSTKTCRFCGSINKNIGLKDRKWICQECGSLIDRDVNAAINIREYAISL